MVGTTILPTIANEVTGATTDTNVTGASITITNLMPLFFALGIMAGGIAVAVGGLQDAGLM